MSVKITKINLTDLQYWSGSKWESLKCKDMGSASLVDLGPNSNNKIQLFPFIELGGISMAGDEHDPNSTFQHSIDWTSFQVSQDGATATKGFTIFGIDDSLLDVAAPSIKIRYKLECWDNANPANVYANSILYYQIIKAAHPSDHIHYTGMVQSGLFAPQIKVFLPGVSNNMAANSDALFSWMARRANWILNWTKPGGQSRVYTPNSVSILNTAPEAQNPEYGGAVVVIDLVFPSINIAHSGQHKLELQFLPNDQQSGGYHLFADNEIWTAVVTAYTPSMDEPLMMSFDKNLFLEITFSASDE